MTPSQEQVCKLIGSGMLLSEITALDGMPARESIYRWLREDAKFAAEFELARRQAADGLDEEIHRLATSATRENANVVRVQVDALKWRAGRLHPAKYGVPPAAIAEAAADAVSREVDVEDARARISSELDAIAERLASHDAETFFVSRLVDRALRQLESQRRLDPMDADDRALIFATVRQAITPTSVPEAPLDAGEFEVGSNRQTAAGKFQTVCNLPNDDGADPFDVEASDRVHEDSGPAARGRSRINPRHHRGMLNGKMAGKKKLAEPEITGRPCGKKVREHACCAKG